MVEGNTNKHMNLSVSPASNKRNHQYSAVGLTAYGDARRCYNVLPGATHDTTRPSSNAEGTTAVWSGTCGLFAVYCY